MFLHRYDCIILYALINTNVCFFKKKKEKEECYLLNRSKEFVNKHNSY